MSYLDLTGVQSKSLRLAFYELVLILDGIYLEWNQQHGKHPAGNINPSR